VFFYGANAQSTPLGDGNLCVAGKIFRLKPVLKLGSDGSATLDLDFTTGTLASGPGAIINGSSWNFQAWFRDPGGTGSNLSNGLRVTFCD